MKIHDSKHENGVLFYNVKKAVGKLFDESATNRFSTHHSIPLPLRGERNNPLFLEPAPNFSENLALGLGR